MPQNAQCHKRNSRKTWGNRNDLPGSGFGLCRVASGIKHEDFGPGMVGSPGPLFARSKRDNALRRHPLGSPRTNHSASHRKGEEGRHASVARICRLTIVRKPNEEYWPLLSGSDPPRPRLFRPAELELESQLVHDDRVESVRSLKIRDTDMDMRKHCSSSTRSMVVRRQAS